MGVQIIGDFRSRFPGQGKIKGMADNHSCIRINQILRMIFVIDIAEGWNT